MLGIHALKTTSLLVLNTQRFAELFARSLFQHVFPNLEGKAE